MDRALARNSPEATMFEWVRTKLGVSKEEAEMELKAKHRTRKERI